MACKQGFNNPSKFVLPSQIRNMRDLGLGKRLMMLQASINREGVLAHQA